MPASRKVARFNKRHLNRLFLRVAGPFAVMGFTVARGKIVEIDVLADPARLAQLDLAVLDD